MTTRGGDDDGASRLERRAADIERSRDFTENPYFRALRERTWNRDDFAETQIQFFFAVEFFSRPMAALAAKIPTPELRMEILRNVWEEHGTGDAKATHKATHLEFLRRAFGLAAADVERRDLWPELRIFNTTLAGACVLDDYRVGAGVLGMIERMFASISSAIGRGVVDNGWLTKDRMIHFDLHEVVDVRHSRDFFAVLETTYDDPSSTYAVDQGLEMGAAVFDGLFRGLHASRTRRTSMPEGAAVLGRLV
ncbi:MAG: iron-containing redox enzyme family protein [Polyangiaceae bacterium]